MSTLTAELDSQIAATEAELASARGAYNAALAGVRSSGDRAQALGSVSALRSSTESLEAELQALKSERNLVLARDSSQAEIDRRQRLVDSVARIKSLLVGRVQAEAVLADGCSIGWIRSIHSYIAASRVIEAEVRDFVSTAWPNVDHQLSQWLSFIDQGGLQGHGLILALQSAIRAALRPLPDSGANVVELQGAYTDEAYRTFKEDAAAFGGVRLGMALDNAIRELGLDTIEPTPAAV